MERPYDIVVPHRPRPRTNLIAMIHVHSTTALLQHTHMSRLGIVPPSGDETRALNALVVELESVYADALQALPLVRSVVSGTGCGVVPLRSIVFLLAVRASSHRGAPPQQAGGATSDTARWCDGASWVVKACLDRFASLPFVKALVDRAVREASIYVQHGIFNVEVENVAAPYFTGIGSCPWEELLCVHTVCQALRQTFPFLSLGAHVLSCNETEALPIAIACGAYFVRSEASLFKGLRPEGTTDNRSNLARFMYLRRVLRDLVMEGIDVGIHRVATAATPLLATTSPDLEMLARLRGNCFVTDKEQERPASVLFPQLWSDIQKKHTVFPEELLTIGTWLHNASFCKLEGIIVTGLETGMPASAEDLAAAREEVDRARHMARTSLAADGAGAPVGTADRLLPPWYVELPLVTGSGSTFEVYCRYVDYMIVGSSFKTNGYWENPVDAALVAQTVRRVTDLQSSIA